jgi:hypothetical protein
LEFQPEAQINTSDQTPEDPFTIWAAGIGYDSNGNIGLSKQMFVKAAKDFFDSASLYPEVATAYFEYSTLMDGYATIQKCRELITKAGDIFRSTVHFAFLSPYVAACAGLEVLSELYDGDPEKFQACKNCIALFEQAKMVLSFRDERHPTLELINAYLRLAISKGLKIEAWQAEKAKDLEGQPQDNDESSEILSEEFRDQIRKLGRKNSRLEYFPTTDYERASNGAFLLGYPSGKKLSLLNVGSSSALLTKIGNIETKSEIKSKSGLQIGIDRFEKMKIRISYKDIQSNRFYDEGCISLV